MLLCTVPRMLSRLAGPAALEGVENTKHPVHFFDGKVAEMVATQLRVGVYHLISLSILSFRKQIG